MVYIISRPTRREAESQRQEALAKRGLDPKRFRGVARETDEAHDKQRELERQGETFDKLWEVSGDSADAKVAHESEMLKHGINPEAMELLHSESTKHD